MGKIKFVGNMIHMEGLNDLAVKEPAKVAKMTLHMEGTKKWIKGGIFSVENTPHNRRKIEDALGIKFPSSKPKLQKTKANRPPWESKMDPYPHQSDALTKGRDLDGFAIFTCMGSGKTKMAIDLTGEWWSAGEIDAILLCVPKNVMRQWVEDEYPKHATHEPVSHVWGSGVRSYQKVLKSQPMALPIGVVNHESVGTDKFAEFAAEFIRVHGKVALIVDESHKVKSPEAQRSEAIRELAGKCARRIIMTGTPIAKNLLDAWNQYRILDPEILGSKYQATFKQEFCIKGGFQRKQIVGFKNIERFHSLVDPFTHRVNKADLGLPEKIHVVRPFDMTPAQRKKFNQMKHEFLTRMESGEPVTASDGLALLIRLQQITHGRLHSSDPKSEEWDALDNPRMKTLVDALDQQDLEEKVVIWGRYQLDVQQIMEALGPAAVAYYGPVSDADRRVAKDRFLNDPDTRYFVGTPAAAGTGTDGLQKVSGTAIYYGHTHNAIDRWQAEDRIDRIGMKATGGSVHIDLVCRAGVDRSIMRNVAKKGELSKMALDDIRKTIEGIEL